MIRGKQRSSSGHSLGSTIGDWFERYFVLPLLQKVAFGLNLYLDNRFISRPGRGSEKIIWADVDGNEVDYDFVLELNGTDNQKGIPVAFVESCWRRGARHSKDKARDDSGKLLPMRDQYPTARFLGMIVSGDFTRPARDLILSRDIDLFYVPKEKIVGAFRQCGLEIDYDDKAPEREKAKIAGVIERNFTETKKESVVSALGVLVGSISIDAYIHRVRASLSATPQEIRINCRHSYPDMVFDTLEDVTVFLGNPSFNMKQYVESYVYRVTYSDGYEFEKDMNSLQEMKQLHDQLVLLAEHMGKLY